MPNLNPLPPQKWSLPLIQEAWAKMSPAERSDFQRPAKTMLHAKLEKDNPAIIPVQLLKLYVWLSGVSNQKLPACVSAVLANGVGQVYHENRLVTSPKEVENLSGLAATPSSENTGAIRAGGTRQATAHLWRVRFVLPDDGPKSLQEYTALMSQIETDQNSIEKGIEEAMVLASDSIAQCKAAREKLQKTGAAWAIVADIQSQHDKAAKAVIGLEALGDSPALKIAKAELKQDIARYASEIQQSTVCALKGEVYTAGKTHKTPAKPKPAKTDNPAKKAVKELSALPDLLPQGEAETTQA